MTQPHTWQHKSRRLWRAFPVTLGVIALCIAVAVLSMGGENFAVIRWLTFVDVVIHGEWLTFDTLAHALDANQWWRLWTPIFLHFGLLHIAMNSLWYWELGRRIEARHGSLGLIGLTSVAALGTNAAQYFTDGPAIFGGLSGVLYALLGYCWVFQRLAPTPAFALPRGVAGMMLIWLVVCLLDIPSLLGLGEIANAAHVSGLLIGVFAGLGSGFVARCAR